jgi:hypothetical protein
MGWWVMDRGLGRWVGGWWAAGGGLAVPLPLMPNAKCLASASEVSASFRTLSCPASQSLSAISNPFAVFVLALLRQTHTKALTGPSWPFFISRSRVFWTFQRCQEGGRPSNDRKAAKNDFGLRGRCVGVLVFVCLCLCAKRFWHREYHSKSSRNRLRSNLKIAGAIKELPTIVPSLLGLALQARCVSSSLARL